MPESLLHSERAAVVGQLYRAHHGWLHSWLRRRLGCSCDAADIAQETFLRLLRRPQVPAVGEQPRALLSHMAKGLVIDLWRRQDLERAYRETLANLPEALVPSPETQWLILETLQLIQDMLDGLPPLTVRIFCAAQFEGLLYRQIAEREALALVTVKRHMQRAFLACLSAMDDRP